MKIKILVPIYNDWQSLSKLIDEINNLSLSPEFQLSIIIVNDASNHDRQEQNNEILAGYSAVIFKPKDI